MSLTGLCALGAAAALARWLRDPNQRRMVALGLLTVAFGLGSAAVAGAGDPTLAAAGSATRAIDGGFVIAGVLLVIWSGVRGWSTTAAAVGGPPGGVTVRLPAGLLVATAVLLGWQASGLIVSAGIGAGFAAAAVLLIGGAIVAFAGLVSHRRPPDAAAIGAATPAPTRWSGRRRLTVLAGALLAILAPNAWLVIAGALLASGAVSLVLLVVVAAGLLPSLWFMATVAGPVGLRVATLGTVPFSPTAEAMLAPALALGAFGLFGLWPLRRWGMPLLLPVGVAVLLRLGAGIPDGLASWETVLVPLGVIALGHALIAADAVEALAAGAWMAAATGGRTGAVLLAAAVVLAVAAKSAALARPAAARWGVAASAAPGAAGGALALRSVLGAEVVYAVISLIVVAALIARVERR